MTDNIADILRRHGIVGADTPPRQVGDPVPPKLRLIGQAIDDYEPPEPESEGLPCFMPSGGMPDRLVITRPVIDPDKFIKSLTEPLPGNRRAPATLTSIADFMAEQKPRHQGPEEKP